MIDNNIILKDIQVSKETGKQIFDKNGNLKNNDWKLKKEKSIKLSESYFRLGGISEKYFYKSEVVSKCGSYLEFFECNQGHKKLSKAYFCKDRLCPICNWRRTLMMQKQMHDILEVALNRKSNMKFIFLTLTVKNCFGFELSEEITKLMIGFNKLFKYQKVSKSVIGYFRTLEITRNNNFRSKFYGTYHPHFHVLISVEENYFYSNDLYITKTEWWNLWKKALKIDYEPNINIRVVKSKEFSTNDFELNSDAKIAYKKAVVETAKYTVKDSDYILDNLENTDEIVKDLSFSLKNRRLFGTAGLFKEIKQELKLIDVESDEIDLIGIENEKQCFCSVCQGEMFKTLYTWRLGFHNGVEEFNYFKT